jgi:hypothetical protein
MNFRAAGFHAINFLWIIILRDGRTCYVHNIRIDVLLDSLSGMYQVIIRNKFGRITSRKTMQFPSLCLFVGVDGRLDIIK